MGNHSVRVLGVLVAGVLVAAACGGKNKKGPADPLSNAGGDSVVPKVDETLCETKGKRVETYDLDRNQSPDVWKLYMTIEEGGARLEILTCKQVDLDHDGKKDYVVAYNKKGAMEFEKFDFDFDGRFDAYSIYDVKSGQVVETQRDSDFDGKYDLTESYDENGVLTSIKRDRNADTAPDVWEQYVAGNLVAILYDDDFDRKVDRREEYEKDKKAESDAESPPADEPETEEGSPEGDAAAEPGEQP